MKLAPLPARARALSRTRALHGACDRGGASTTPPPPAGEALLLGECQPALPLADRLFTSAAEVEEFVASPARGMSECAAAFTPQVQGLDFSQDKVLAITSELRSFTVDGARLVVVSPAPCEEPAKRGKAKKGEAKARAEEAPPPSVRFYRIGLASAPEGIFKLGVPECGDPASDA
ncbi:MAG: hypothetical protein H6710_09175 [Myxococcales bacterium]|nr:hypothetical protein [Myxococcales bacterium]